MKRALGLLLVIGCHEPASRAKLPGAAITPELARSQPRMCGVDVDWNGDRRIDMRYRFTLDEHGRISAGRGIYAEPYPEDTIEYEWDNLDHFVRYVHTRGGDGVRYEATALYNSLGDLLEYTASQPESRERYSYSQFGDTGQPTHEVIDNNGDVVTVALE